MLENEVKWLTLIVIACSFFVANSSPSGNELNFRAASAQITAELYKRFGENKKENVFFSPLSIASGLAILTEGSNGKTREALESVTGIKGLARSQFQNITESLLPVGTESGGTRIRMVNSIWIPIDEKMPESFAKSIKTYYKAETRAAAFERGDEVVKIVNDRVSKDTEGVITNLLQEGSISSNTRLLMTNALYFNGKWKYSFVREDTAEANFTNSNGDIVKVQMMNTNVTAKSGHSSSIRASIAVLPYDDDDERFAMVVIVPDEGIDYKVVEEDLFQDPETLRKTIHRLSIKDIEVSLPRFELEPTIDLKLALQNMGLGMLFTNEANLPNIIYNKNAVVSSCMHKAKITVNEEGTEAAAASVFQITPLMADFDQTREVHANRSFIFAIWDNLYDVALFVGRVADPSVAVVETKKKSTHKQSHREKRQINSGRGNWRSRQADMGEAIASTEQTPEDSTDAEDVNVKGVTGPSNWWKPTPDPIVVIQIPAKQTFSSLQLTGNSNPTANLNKVVPENARPSSQANVPKVSRPSGQGFSFTGNGPIVYIGQTNAAGLKQDLSASQVQTFQTHSSSFAPQNRDGEITFPVDS